MPVAGLGAGGDFNTVSGRLLKTSIFRFVVEIPEVLGQYGTSHRKHDVFRGCFAVCGVSRAVRGEFSNHNLVDPSEPVCLQYHYLP